MDKNLRAVILAILAALLYGISAPVSKILLRELSPTMMAALLYLGAGIGMLIVSIIKSLSEKECIEARITRRELPYVIGMIVLDIAAPIFLMIGLTMTTSSNVSLLNNFEIVATSMIALFIFKEAVGKRMWVAIILITLSSILLSIEDVGHLSLSLGSIFVILASLSWGLENNCTRMLSIKDPIQVVVIKGFGSGIGALIIAGATGAYTFNVAYVGITLLLGFVAYGMSIYLYISAQRELGAARTSAYYATAPFIGVIISWIVLKEPITSMFSIALIVMLLGTYFAVTENHAHRHSHVTVTHEHKHNHSDGHHNHLHLEVVEGEHSHEHTHEPIIHEHAHLPDLHHRHSH